MRKKLPSLLFLVASLSCTISFAQCTIDTTNTHVGFTPATPAVIQPGIAYSQTVQVYVPPTYNVGGGESYIVDSLHIDSATGMPTGITYVLNPSNGTVLGGFGGAICFSGTTNDTVGPYPLTFYGDIYTNAGEIPFSYLVSLDPSFGYKFRVETSPVAGFIADSPVCASGDTVHFTDLTTGYPTHWNWTFAGGIPATSTFEFPQVVYDSAGTYAVMLIARNSISIDTITQNVTVNPSVTGSVVTAPATGADSAANGSAVVTASGGTPPFTYAWSNGAGSDTLANAVSGLYAVSVTDIKGCKYVNDTVSISFVSAVVQLGPVQQVKIYPNPATDVLNLVWGVKSNAEVSVIDLKGQVVKTFITVGAMNNVYDIHELAAGSYLLRIFDKTSNQQQSVQFSKF